MLSTAHLSSIGFKQCSLCAPNLTSRAATQRTSIQRGGPSLFLRSTTKSKALDRHQPSRVVSVQSAMSMPSSNGLLIVGPGVLGSYVGKLWLDQFGAGTVVGQTNTTNNHDRLKHLGLMPCTKETCGSEKFPNVVFSAPPSGSEDYLGEVKAALERWDGSGTFVYTSSAAVYPVDDGSLCDEDTPLLSLGSNPRVDKLLQVEQAVLQAGGCVVRLVGLYHTNRGPHTFFLKQAEVERWGGYTVNLIHYEDAASLTLAVLAGQGSSTGPYRGMAFVGCDGAPVTFEDMMAAVVRSGVFPGGSYKFTGEEGASKGKRMSNARTRQQLGWAPKYASFASFFEGGAQDWYNSEQQQGKVPTGMQHA